MKIDEGLWRVGAVMLVLFSLDNGDHGSSFVIDNMERDFGITCLVFQHHALVENSKNLWELKSCSCS